MSGQLTDRKDADATDRADHHAARSSHERDDHDTAAYWLIGGLGPVGSNGLNRPCVMLPSLFVVAGE